MSHIVLATCLSWPEIVPSEAPLVQVLKQRGHTVTAVPWNGISQTKFQEADIVLLRGCWDYHEMPQRFLSWLDDLDANNILVRNPTDMVRWNFDKSYLLELQEAGIVIPKTKIVNPQDNAETIRIMHEEGWSKAVRKPIMRLPKYQVDHCMPGWMVSYEMTNLSSWN